MSGTGSNPNSHYVSPHTTSNGIYVGGHYANNSNNKIGKTFHTVSFREIAYTHAGSL